MRRRRWMLWTGLGLFCVFSAATAGASVSRAAHRRATRAKPAAEVRSRPAPKASGGRGGTVAFTVLPGDTHAKLAADLTGRGENAPALRKIDPTLKPGERIRVPAGLLLPGLSSGPKEALVCGRQYPTMWSVARRTSARTPLELGRTARNLQRLNAILVADRVAPGTKILVPKSWLSVVEEEQEGPAPAAEAPPQESGQKGPDVAEPAATVPAPAVAAPAVPAPASVGSRAPGPFEIRRQYQVRDVEGLERRGGRLPSRLRQLLSPKEFEEAQAGRGDVNLVVVHTTEHRGSTFENTASYIRRKRLANYLIGPDGAAYEVVPEEHRAFGAGDSVWDGRYIVDLEAINVEIFANTDKGPHQGTISDAQYEGLKALIADIRARRPKVDERGVVTHKMVALNFKTGMRSRKGDPYEFDWAKAGLPDNSQIADRDMLDGRAKICTDCRFTDRITVGQTEAAKILKKL